MQNSLILPSTPQDESAFAHPPVQQSRNLHRTPAYRNAAVRQEELVYLPWWDFYFKTQEIAAAYLTDSYDHLFYVARGGMSVAHRLAHLLTIPPGGTRMSPLSIQRHTSDAIQSRSVRPKLQQPIAPELVTGKRLLLVEDAIGRGETLLCALTALRKHRPRSIDVVTVGLDHAEFLRWSNRTLRKLLPEIIVCFDYWGWMVFPWETQAADVFQTQQPYSAVPYAQQTPTERRTVWQACGNYSLQNPAYDALWQEDFASVVLPAAHAASTIIEMCPGDAPAWLAGQFSPESTCLPLARESITALYSYPRATIDMLLLRNIVPSQLGIGCWNELAQVVCHALRPGGYFFFDYLDRTRIVKQADVKSALEYFSARLLSQLLRRYGVIPVNYKYPAPTRGSAVALACFKRM